MAPEPATMFASIDDVSAPATKTPELHLSSILAAHPQTRRRRVQVAATKFASTARPLTTVYNNADGHGADTDENGLMLTEKNLALLRDHLKKEGQEDCADTTDEEQTMGSSSAFKAGRSFCIESMMSSRDEDGTLAITDKQVSLLRQHPMVTDRSLQISFMPSESGRYPKEIVSSTICGTGYLVFSGTDSPLSLYHWQVEQEPIYYSGRKFPGSQALDLFGDIVTRLRPGHIDLPDVHFLSTLAIKQTTFGCVAQFMLAIRAWYTDRVGLMCTDSTATQKSAAVKAILRCQKRHKPQDICRRPVFGILRATSGASAHAYAAKTQHQNDTWLPIAECAVIAGIIARAECCPIVKDLILRSNDRKFVEASITDGYWGIKMGLRHQRIFDESSWQGKNKLGWCYARAREYLRGQKLQVGDKMS